MYRLACAAIVVAVLCVSAPAAARDARPFAPVQAGPGAHARLVDPRASGRLLVQFTSGALSRSRLDIPFARGATARGTSTGLATIDALLVSGDLTAVERPYAAPADLMRARSLGVDRWFRLQLGPAADVERLAAALARDPAVAAVSFDWLALPAAIPPDPLYQDHWGHHNTAQLPAYDWDGTWDHTGPPVGLPGFDADAEAAWDGDQGFGSASVVIAIVDSGVDRDHPDLRLVTGYDFGCDDPDPDDDAPDAGHGTCCAGIAAAVRNSLGCAGIAADCSIMPLKVADDAGDIYFTAIQNALYFAADQGADIISLSLGADVASDPATDTALRYAHGAGCVILAATGNENAASIGYPANHGGVIGVGAASPCGERKRSSSDPDEVSPGVHTDSNGVTCDDERWWGSNHGVATADAAGAVDVLAPTILPTTDIGGSGGYASGDVEPFFNGTSCATPYAAGVCALIKARHRDWTNVQIRDQLCRTARDVVSIESTPGWDRYSGYGLVDAADAVGQNEVFAPLPYATGFETGNLDDCWTTHATSDGRVQVTTAGGPHEGHYHLTLDDRVGGGSYSRNEAWLRLDLSGQSEVTLDFWWQEFNEETHSRDGVYLSVDGGGSFVKIHGLDGAGTPDQTWQRVEIDVVALAGAHGLTLGATSVIKFQQYDNSPIPTDGIAIDAVAVTGAQGAAWTVITSDDFESGWGSYRDGGLDCSRYTDGARAHQGEAAIDIQDDSGAGSSFFHATGHDVTAFGELEVDFWYLAVGMEFGEDFRVQYHDGHAWRTAATFTRVTDFQNGVFEHAVVPIPRESFAYPVNARLRFMCDASSDDDDVYIDEISFRGLSNRRTRPRATEPTIDAGFALGANQPNPFNPLTSISFSLPANAHATLRVFDVRGQVVATLVDEVVTAGNHAVRWDARDQASGIYFYRLDAPGFSQTRRMTLLR